MTNTLKQESRPITLFVARIGKDVPSLDHTKKERVTVIDVELSKQDAETLKTLLEGRIDSNAPGAIRFRLFGNLVLG